MRDGWICDQVPSRVTSAFSGWAVAHAREIVRSAKAIALAEVRPEAEGVVES